MPSLAVVGVVKIDHLGIADMVGKPSNICIHREGACVIIIHVVGVAAS